MSEVTQAEAPVQNDAPEMGIDDKLAAKFGFADEPPSAPAEVDEAPAADVETPETPETDELGADEVIEDSEPKKEGDPEYEVIIHNGQEKRLTKEEIKTLARQGFDYTQKTQAVAEDRRILEQRKQAIEAREQLIEKSVEAAATVRAIQMQLSPYQNVDWVALATQQPNDYAAHHAQFQRLQDALRQAQGHLMTIGQQTANVTKAESELDVAEGMRRLLGLVPAWKNQDSFKRDRSRILSTLQEQGVDAKKLNQITNDPDILALARDAALYREAIKNRAAAKNKVKQAPAVRPGAAPTRASAGEQRETVMKQLHQAKDPQRKAALLDSALALKFGIK